MGNGHVRTQTGQWGELNVRHRGKVPFEQRNSMLKVLEEKGWS